MCTIMSMGAGTVVSLRVSMSTSTKTRWSCDFVPNTLEEVKLNGRRWKGRMEAMLVVWVIGFGHSDRNEKALEDTFLLTWYLGRQWIFMTTSSFRPCLDLILLSRFGCLVLTPFGSDRI